MLVLVLVLVPRCAAWDTVHFIISRRNGAPAGQIFLVGDGRKIRELAGFKRAQNPVMEFSSAEALFGLLVDQGDNLRARDQNYMPGRGFSILSATPPPAGT